MKLFAPLFALPFAASTNAAGLPVVDGRSSDDLLALLTDMQAKIRSLEIGVVSQVEKIAKLEANGVRRGLMSESPPGQQSKRDECASTINYNFIGGSAIDFIFYGDDPDLPNCPTFLSTLNITDDDNTANRCVSNCINTNFNGGEIDGPFFDGMYVGECDSNCGNSEGESKIDLNDESRSKDLADLVKSIVLSTIGYNPACENKKGRKACQKTDGCEWALNTCSPMDIHATVAGATSKIDGTTKKISSASIKSTTKIAAWGWLLMVWAPFAFGSA